MSFGGSRTTVLWLVIGITISMHPQAARSQPSPTPGSHKTASTEIGSYDRSPGPARQTRSVTYAQHGMAATSDLRSTQAAVDILREGGSAVDAAIAANCVLGVVEPMSCGIGGDLFSIVWDAKKGELAGLNASGRAPQLATLAEFQKRRRRGGKHHPGGRKRRFRGRGAGFSLVRRRKNAGGI